MGKKMEFTSKIGKAGNGKREKTLKNTFFKATFL
jgi:hypothetical protein